MVICRASYLNSPTWGYSLNLSIWSDSWVICSSFDLLNYSFNNFNLLNAWDNSCCFWIACWSILCFSLSNCSFNWSFNYLWTANYCSNCSIFCCFYCAYFSSKMISWYFSLSKLLTFDALYIVVVVYAAAYWESLVRSSEGLSSSLHNTFVSSNCEVKRGDWSTFLFFPLSFDYSPMLRAVEDIQWWYFFYMKNNFIGGVFEDYLYILVNYGRVAISFSQNYIDCWFLTSCHLKCAESLKALSITDFGSKLLPFLNQFRININSWINEFTTFSLSLLRL